jgi:tetratricopeptide (TPR) repeat protein
MLCELQKAKKSSLRTGFLPVILLNVLVIGWAPSAHAQISDLERSGGVISGTVLLQADKKPATQVAVSLKSHSAGIFCSVLTDYDGRFEVRDLPPGTYDIVVAEQGYERVQTTAQFDGSPAKLVLYLKSSSTAQSHRNDYVISVRELKIPGKAQSEYHKGLELLAKKDLSGSLSHFTKAVQAFPAYYEAFYHMGVVQTTLSRMDEALQAFQKAIDLSGGRYARAAFGVGYVLYLQGKPAEAEPIVRRGLDLDANSAEGHVILSMTLLQLNRTDEAEKSAREALLQKPDFAQAYLVLADVYARRRDYRGQLQGLEAYLKLDPTGPAITRVNQARELALRNLGGTRIPN